MVPKVVMKVTIFFYNFEDQVIFVCGLGQLGAVGIRLYHQGAYVVNNKKDLAGPKARLTLVKPLSCLLEGDR